MSNLTRDMGYRIKIGLPLLFFIGMLFINGCINSSNTPEMSAVNFEVIPTIELGNIFENKSNYVVKNLSEWTALTGLNTVSPNVNFDEKMLIISAYGLKLTSGYSVDIDRIRNSGGIGFFVDVKYTNPGLNCVRLHLFTYPVTVVKLNTTRNSAYFSETTVTSDCPD